MLHLTVKTSQRRWAWGLGLALIGALTGAVLVEKSFGAGQFQPSP
jgi:hypothetical protein